MLCHVAHWLEWLDIHPFRAASRKLPGSYNIGKDRWRAGCVEFRHQHGTHTGLEPPCVVRKRAKNNTKHGRNKCASDPTSTDLKQHGTWLMGVSLGTDELRPSKQSKRPIDNLSASNQPSKTETPALGDPVGHSSK